MNELIQFNLSSLKSIFLFFKTIGAMHFAFVKIYTKIAQYYQLHIIKWYMDLLY